MSEPFHVDAVDPQRVEMGDFAWTRRRLGAAAGATRLGVAIMQIDPGARANPPHSHADEEEIFLVLAGSGLSYQTSGSTDARAYAIGVDDILVHAAGGDAHTLIAGPDGLTVLILAEGSRTGITYLTRAKQFWLGSRWVPADAPPPFKLEAELPPLEVPEPVSERPATVRNLSELPLTSGSDGPLAWATRGARDVGSRRLVLAQDDLPPGTHNTERHFHSAREECWYVRAGSGVARLGDAEYPLSAGWFWLMQPNSGVGHRVEAGPDGLDLVTMGDLVDGDVTVYPDRGVAQIARGVEVPYTPGRWAGN